MRVSPSGPDPIPKPRLVFRVGFAGKRRLDYEACSRLGHVLTNVFAVMAKRLVEIAPLHEVAHEQPVPAIARFYSQETPVLRLVAGLCEGADETAFRTFEAIIQPHLEKDFAAVIPWDPASYRASRGKSFFPEFDRQAALCSYIVVADGHHDPLREGDPGATEPAVALATRRRRRGYRLQSALLLRQSDILVAVVDPEEEGKPGGTLETVRSALAFELPVVLIHPRDGRILLIEPGDDLLTVLGRDAEEDTPAWNSTLEKWITQIVADPERSEDVLGHEAASHGVKLLEEFFGESHHGPPGQFRFRRWLWKWVESKCKTHTAPAAPAPPSPPAPDPLPGPGDTATWKNRASALSRRYTGLYRGTWFLNHILAVVAVCLATGSLVLLGDTSSHVAKWLDSAAVAAGLQTPPVPQAALHDTAHTGSAPPSWLFPVLFLLALLKLWIVVVIFRGTHHAIHGEWNDCTVDYRYLAERLRHLPYLAAVGSFQPPAAAPAQYASRVVRQSAVDWLFDAMVRSASPAGLAKDVPHHFPGGRPLTLRLITLRSADTLARIGAEWIGGQADYHVANARAMKRFATWLEGGASRLNIAVITIVAIDIALVTMKLLHWTDSFKTAALLTGSFLVFLAAAIPAAVAALNGIRFQSECQRLSERSSAMFTILRGRRRKDHQPRFGGRGAEVIRLQTRLANAAANPATDPGAWALESLHLTEKVANDFVQEVAEWSVLYAKELVEP